jgi:oligopeptidase B
LASPGPSDQAELIKSTYMNSRIICGFVSMVIIELLLAGCSENQKSPAMRAPIAKIEKKKLTIHGDTRQDNYFWLNQRENPEVVAYLEEENAYTKSMMSHTEAFQEKLFNEIVGRIQQTDISVPYLENGYYYYNRFEQGKEYPLYCRKKGNLDASEEVMLDVNKMAEGHSFYEIGSYQVSEDNTLLAFAADTVSRRIYTIYFKDLVTGEILPDKIDSTAGNLAWANDNRTLFYATKDESLRMDKIWKHRLGGKAGGDFLVYNEADVTYNTFVYKTKSRKYLVIGSESTLSDEYRFLDAGNPDGNFTLFQQRQPNLEYDIAHYNDRFYIRTNYKATNFRLMETSPDKTGIENWKEVIPHREDVLLEEFDVFKDFLAIQERKDGMKTLRIFNGSDLDYYLKFDDQAYTVTLGQNAEFETDVVRYNYTSLTTPMTVYDYDIKTRKSELKKRQEVVGGYNPDDYYTERLMATAEDGTRIPVSVVYKKGLKKDGKNPCLLYGYGSYGYSMDPYFSSVRLSLLDRGFIYAIAHIRGGQEMGRKWYEDGKLMNKKNTFTDFIACGEYLVSQAYTMPGHLYAMGGSAGGLLVGAVFNMRPDLFNGVIAAVPFVDVVTTMLDESIPLTTAEYDEWGNPNDSSCYRYMLSYSPYDNVAVQYYPALLVTTGLHDSQVQYWEPAKWVAKLRVMKTDKNPLYLWTNMDYGHGGASGRFERYRETALEYAFILDLEGIKE